MYPPSAKIGYTHTQYPTNFSFMSGTFWVHFWREKAPNNWGKIIEMGHLPSTRVPEKSPSGTGYIPDMYPTKYPIRVLPDT